MTLPKLDTPIYEMELPIINKKIRFRPFLVKEEKLLLIAMESNDEKTIMTTIKQIVNNCCIDQIDLDTLPLIDLEMIFLNLRARSIGETVDLEYKCNNIVIKDEKESKCGNIMKYSLDLLAIKPNIPNKDILKIELTSSMGVMMKYPDFKLMEDDSEETPDKILEKIIKCIEYIYDADSIFYTKDHTIEEMKEFLEGFNKQQFNKIEKFFESIPKIETDIDFCCSKCGHKEKIHLEGIHSFFV